MGRAIAWWSLITGIHGGWAGIQVMLLTERREMVTNVLHLFTLPCILASVFPRVISE